MMSYRGNLALPNPTWLNMLRISYKYAKYRNNELHRSLLIWQLDTLKQEARCVGKSTLSMFRVGLLLRVKVGKALNIIIITSYIKETTSLKEEFGLVLLR